jgi:2-methylcitrate dehydratase PrpD
MAALDGAFGFVEVMAGGRSTLAEQFERLGQPYDLETPGLAYKYYPSCSDTHIAVDTLLDLVDDEAIAIDEITRIRCGATQAVFDNLIYAQPRSGLEGKFSLHYCLARALEKRGLTLSDFTDEEVRKPSTQALMRRIEFFVDENIQSDSFCSPASISLMLRDGRTVGRLGSTARGHSGRPLSEAQMAEKFFACARTTLSLQSAERLYEMIGHVETLPNISLLADLLGSMEQGHG